MTYRVVAKALRTNGCTSAPGKGDHEKWTCSCGRNHMAVIVKTNAISPGVIRDTIKKLACLPEGWLQ